MSEVLRLNEYLAGKNIFDSFLVVAAFVTLLVIFINVVLKYAGIIYRKKKGIDTRDEFIDKTLVELRQDIDDLELKWTADIQNVCVLNTEATKQLQDTINHLSSIMEGEACRARESDQAMLRAEIIRSYKEIKEKEGKVTPTEKENMDLLFKNYFNCNGNGVIKDIKTDYDKITSIDYSHL